MDVAISLQNLTLYHERVKILEGLNVDFSQGTFTAVIGNNGSGKSTLLRAISALHFQYQGDITIFGKSLQHYNNLFADGFLSFLGQRHQVNFDLNVEQLLLMGRFRFRNHLQSYTVEDKEKMLEVATRLGLLPLLSKGFHEISGGEQQLVMFAQTIIQDAQIYVLDEPTQNLDIRNTDFLFATIRELINQGKTVLCATHDLHFLSSMSGNLLDVGSEEKTLIPISQESIAFAISDLTAPKKAVHGQ